MSRRFFKATWSGEVEDCDESEAQLVETFGGGTLFKHEGGHEVTARLYYKPVGLSADSSLGEVVDGFIPDADTLENHFAERWELIVQGINAGEPNDAAWLRGFLSGLAAADGHPLQWEVSE